MYKPARKATTAWKAPPTNCLKWNTYASRIVDKNLITSGLICSVNKGRIIHNMGKTLGDVLVLVTEAIVIREALRVMNVYKMDNILM